MPYDIVNNIIIIDLIPNIFIFFVASEQLASRNSHFVKLHGCIGLD